MNVLLGLSGLAAVGFIIYGSYVSATTKKPCRWPDAPEGTGYTVIGGVIILFWMIVCKLFPDIFK